MTVADAIHALAITGARLTTSPDGGIALVVPDGATIPRQVLDVLRDHREQLVPVVGSSAAFEKEKEKQEKPPGGCSESPADLFPPFPSPVAAPSTVNRSRIVDLADYLAEKEITGSTADLVLHAAQAFNVATDKITIEGDATAEATPAFFEPGIPAITTVASAAVAVRGGTSKTIPPGALGLLVPQTWAIHDHRQRVEIESIQYVLRSQQRPHVPFWHDGEIHLVDPRSITFEGAVAPDGMNLLPWRPHPQGTPTL
jgi:hypothetical protein